MPQSGRAIIERRRGNFVMERAVLLAVLFALQATGFLFADDAGISEPTTTAADRDHWAFRPLSDPAVPDVALTGWPRNPLDRFILARIEDAGLAPSPEADRVTLIRRVTFDLTGLPPTPKDLDAFLSDPSPDAYERLVDRLLASDAYGARAAQHWLDLARFAETDGFEHDLVRPNAWRYRDWVVAAMNDDLPYDEFVRRQIAGDELYPDDPSAAVATGFLLCGPDMPDINSQEERRHVVLNEMTATVGSVFLGLQVGCAQCHDHKWDPVSQFDFYRLRAFFESAEIFNEKPLVARDALEEASQQAGSPKGALDPLAEVEARALARIRKERGDPNLTLDRDELLSLLNAEEREQQARLMTQSGAPGGTGPPAVPTGRILRERSAAIPESFLRVRGDHARKGPAVRAAFPRIANPDGETVPSPDPGAASTGQRAALARWLTRPDHPLATRVIVNRLWQQHFGRGLAASASDFGIMGDAPTHPELLDWLAAELPRQGWSLKRMHRLIVTSATYRQRSSSAELGARSAGREQPVPTSAFHVPRSPDPDNRLLSRMPRRRLDGEAVRDAMLAAGGTLSPRRGGPGVRPPLPPEVVGTLLRGQWEVTKDRADHDRRSVYLFVRRNLQYPLLAAFDKPDTNATCPRRTQSTTAPQALVLLNSDVSLDAARELAGLALRQAGTDRQARVSFCYRRALSRPATPEEAELAARFLDDDVAQLRAERRKPAQLAVPRDLPPAADPYDAAALTDLCLAIFNLNEFVYVD